MDSDFAVLIWEIREELHKLTEYADTEEHQKLLELLDELETKLQLLPCNGDGL